MIEKIINNMTSKPGIYKMLDRDNKILYIGKALNLKKRVASYFSKSINSIKTNKLVEKIIDIQTIITENEQEALILENTLIKKFKPKYNILLRDDKSYPFIYIDTSHKYPSIKFYRGSKNMPGIFFGPYTQVNRVRHMLNLIQKIFKIRSCDNTYFSNRKKPCLQFQINRCDAPCMNYITKLSYKESLDNSILFLQGKNKTLINNFSNKMNSLSQEKKYEQASFVRDKIAMINSLTESKNIITNQDNIDIVTIASNEINSCIDVFMVRDGVNLGNKIFNFNINNNDKSLMLNSFMKQYYLNSAPPEKIIINEKIYDYLLLSDTLSKNYKKKINLMYANRKPYISWIKICQENTDNRLNQLTSLKDKSDLFFSLKKDLKSKNKINNIICFDVSHLSGSSMVGSSVWFNREGPNKKLYRRFNLPNISKFDDYEAIHNILLRRFKKLIIEDNLPEIILVDGGKGHITQVNKVINELMLSNILIFGIVKGHKRLSRNDRILNNKFKDITLSLSESSMIIFQRIRDEAHRFAITGQRVKTTKKQFASKLDIIPGIGEKRKLEILKYFGGIHGAMKASKNELEKVPGINTRLAEAIHEHLQK
jgi:excinuclease ABC subunit C